MTAKKPSTEPDAMPAESPAPKPNAGRLTVPIKTKAGGTAMVTKEWAKRWPDDVAKSTNTNTEK